MGKVSKLHFDVLKFTLPPPPLRTQALESETLITLTIANERTKIVLAGDHMQVGLAVTHVHLCPVSLTLQLWRVVQVCHQNPLYTVGNPTVPWDRWYSPWVSPVLPYSTVRPIPLYHVG